MASYKNMAIERDQSQRVGNSEQSIGVGMPVTFKTSIQSLKKKVPQMSSFNQESQKSYKSQKSQKIGGGEGSSMGAGPQIMGASYHNNNNESSEMGPGPL